MNIQKITRPAEGTRVLAIGTGAFSAGIFLSQYFLPKTLVLPGLFLCLTVGLLALFLPKLWRKRLLLTVIGLAFALFWNQLYIQRVQEPLESLEGTSQTVTMTICDYPSSLKYGGRAPVKLNSFTYGKVMYYGDSSLLDQIPGREITVPVQFESASCIHGTDISTFTSKGVFLRARQLKGEPVYSEGISQSIRWWPIRIGHAMQEKISDLFPPEEAAFLTAILTGNRDSLSNQASADLSEAGLSHILAVSGMHCGFLMTMMVALLGLNHRRLVALCTIPLLAFYALLTGGSPSVLRACIMLSLIMLAPLVHRENDWPTSLCVALFLILLQNPFAAASVSLQLSFAAVAGLLYLAPKIQKFLIHDKKRSRGFYFVASGFSTTLGALAFTAPLSALYFNRLALLSPITNLLCLGAASLVFLSGLLVVVVGLFCTPLGALLAWIPRLLTAYILHVSHLLASLPLHAIYFSNPYAKYWLLIVYILFAAAYFLGPKRRWKYILVSALSVFALLCTTLLGTRQYSHALDAIVLDVEQGQSILLSSQGSFALLDCGSNALWTHPGDLAADQLQSMGCRKLDYLLLTHYDFDHVSGVSRLLARMPVDVLLVPATEEESELKAEILEEASANGTKILELAQLHRFPLGSACLTVYPPLPAAKSKNGQGLCCLASVEENDLLVTGDISARTEIALLQTYSLPDIEALVVGHHGSKSSTSEELLTLLKPETAYISVGYNSYGHPAEETLQRLENHGCTIHRTDLEGNLSLSFTQGEHHGEENAKIK